MKLPADFDRTVWEIVSQVPAGRVVTYGCLARLAGFPDHARRAGRAMAAAPEGVPCHRVVSAAGRTVPGWSEQRLLLEAEGVGFRPGGCVDLARYGWEALEQ